MLITGAGGLNFYNAKRDSSNDYTRGRQFEAGLGGYATVGPTWLSVAAGAGQGHGYRYGRFKEFSPFGGGIVVVPGGSPGGSRPRIPELTGDYRTVFAQAAAWWPRPNHPAQQWGATIRYANVTTTSLTLNNLPQALPVRQSLQGTLAWQRQWQKLGWQVGASFSVPLTQNEDERVFDPAPLRVGISLFFTNAEPLTSR